MKRGSLSQKRGASLILKANGNTAAPENLNPDREAGQAGDRMKEINRKQGKNSKALRKGTGVMTLTIQGGTGNIPMNPVLHVIKIRAADTTARVSGRELKKLLMRFQNSLKRVHILKPPMTL